MTIEPVNGFLLVECVKIQKKSKLGILLSPEPLDSIFGLVKDNKKYKEITFLEKKNLFTLEQKEYCFIKEEDIFSVGN